jgi:hypothetical protein
MSLIFANPLINLSIRDRGSAGWYKTSNTNTNNLVLRVGDYTGTDALTGFIKYNISEKKFQGYSDDGWVSLGGYTGPTGFTGASFESQVDFINCIKNDSQSIIGPTGSAEIFQTTSISPDGHSTSCVFIRSLFSGTGYINGNEFRTLNLSQASNIIVLDPVAQPYCWDIASSDNNTLTYLSGEIPSSSPSELKCFGEKMSFKALTNITQGQAVCLSNSTVLPLTDIGIRPVSFNSSGITDCFNEPYINIIGIALSSASVNQSCNVCVRGITSVGCVDTSPSSDYALNYTVIGRSGYVNQNGNIFCPNQETTIGYEYIRAGHFLEFKTGLGTSATLTLFYVDPKISGC